MGHPIASSIRDCYTELVKSGKQNEIPLFAGGGVGKNGNLAANAASLIMLGASGVQTGKYAMQAAAGCLGSETDRCNICNIGQCPKGITSQDPRLYRRLDPEKVAERLVDMYVSFDVEPLGLQAGVFFLKCVHGEQYRCAVDLELSPIGKISIFEKSSSGR